MSTTPKGWGRHETKALLRAHLAAATRYRHVTRHCPICHRLLRLAMDPGTDPGTDSGTGTSPGTGPSAGPSAAGPAGAPPRDTKPETAHGAAREGEGPEDSRTK
jgi:hypothetical protein